MKDLLFKMTRKNPDARPTAKEIIDMAFIKNRKMDNKFFKDLPKKSVMKDVTQNELERSILQKHLVNIVNQAEDDEYDRWAWSES